MLNKLKTLFSKKPEPVVEPIVVPVVEAIPAPVKVKKPRKPKEKKIQPVLSAKEIATAASEPYINILSMDIDPTDINAGAFELDWNEIFIARLVKAGYMMKKEDTDSEIVDRWWVQVCRNTALEIYEQSQADPELRDLRKMNTKDLGNGRTEVS